MTKTIGVVLILATFALLQGCDDTTKTFADATRDVNEGFALGKRLRDRCRATNDVDHCQAWLEYKRMEEAENIGLDYDKALARWEEKGPY